jgi:hypothetical protein
MISNSQDMHTRGNSEAGSPQLDQQAIEIGDDN